MVSNGLYRVTSRPATLIVLPAIQVAWEGLHIDGGGGAPSAWFYGLLALARWAGVARTK